MSEAGQSKKQMQLDGGVYDIVDPGIPVVAPDIITECSVINGVVRVSLASIVRDGGGPSELQISTRLRLPLMTAFNLMKSLQFVLQPPQPQEQEEEAGEEEPVDIVKH